MRLTVNGKPREIASDEPAPPDGLALPALLRSFDINPKLVAVAINGDVIAKDAYGAAVVHDGDDVEIVRMVGGGAS